MLDYLTLQGSTENPTFVTIVFTVLLSFLLSSLIAFTYQKTTRHVINPVDFLQALILVSIVASMVMQAIGDSVARGLGMLGALAIIRFRTSLRTPRNLVFTFASLAAGISCGVYGYVIGITGTIGFCISAFVLKYSPLGNSSELTGILKFELPKSSADLDLLEAILKKYCSNYTKIRYQISQRKIKEANGGSKEQEIVEETNQSIDSLFNGSDLNPEELKIIDNEKLDADQLVEEIKTMPVESIAFENKPVFFIQKIEKEVNPTAETLKTKEANPSLFQDKKEDEFIESNENEGIENSEKKDTIEENETPEQLPENENILASPEPNLEEIATDIEALDSDHEKEIPIILPKTEDIFTVDLQNEEEQPILEELEKKEELLIKLLENKDDSFKLATQPEENSIDISDVKPNETISNTIETTLNESTPIPDEPQLDLKKPVLFEKIIAYEYQLYLRKASDSEWLDSEISELDTIQAVKINFEILSENV